jgi:hypothetical protein
MAWLAELKDALWLILLVLGVPAEAAPHQVLAFYYGWYGNPAISGH